MAMTSSHGTTPPPFIIVTIVRAREERTIIMECTRGVRALFESEQYCDGVRVSSAEWIHPHRGEPAGQLQFEVIQYRLLHEYGAACRWEPINLYKACWIESDDPQELENFKKRKSQFMAKDIAGRDVYLADSGYVLSMAQQDFPKIRFHFTSEFGQ